MQLARFIGRVSLLGVLAGTDPSFGSQMATRQPSDEVPWSVDVGLSTDKISYGLAESVVVQVLVRNTSSFEFYIDRKALGLTPPGIGLDIVDLSTGTPVM